MEGTSTGVRQNKDGSYTVVSAKNDGNTGIFIVDKNGNYDVNNSQKIGDSNLPTDFMNANNQTGEFEGHTNSTFRLGQKWNMKIGNGKFKNLSADQIKYIYTTLFNKETKGKGWWDSLNYLKAHSGNGEKFDIKASVSGWNPEDVVTYDNGTMTTVRALGNEIFGANMLQVSDKTIFHKDFFYNQVMPKVGEYNQSQNKGNGYNSGWPFYGEHELSGSYIYRGFYGRFPYGPYKTSPQPVNH